MNATETSAAHHALTDPETKPLALHRMVRPRAWDQKGFVVVSDCNGLPLVHDFCAAQWMAESRVRMIIAELPEHLRKNLEILPATLRYEWPNPQDRPMSKRKTAAVATGKDKPGCASVNGSLSRQALADWLKEEMIDHSRALGSGHLLPASQQYIQGRYDECRRMRDHFKIE